MNTRRNTTLARELEGMSPKKVEFYMNIKVMPAKEVRELLAQHGKAGKTKKDFLEHIRTMSDEDFMDKGLPAILVPLSGKKRPNKDDLSILKKDRETLELMVKSILENKRLAWLIVHRWMEKHGYVMAPKDWLSSKLKHA